MSKRSKMHTTETAAPADVPPVELQGLIVANSKQNPLHGLTGKILAGVVALLVLAAAGWLIYHQTQKPLAAGSICDGQVIERANVALNDGNVTKLTAVFSDLTKRKNNMRDPNCLYIAARYYIATGNTVQAQSLIDKLELYATKSAVFTPKLDNGQASISQLKELNQVKSQTQPNGITSRSDPDI